ncbi:MAG TPA: GtrA family protein [Dermatophilaceae bacterium]|nr:GtrA family protein [Dermatophilaceae bacterium]
MDTASLPVLDRLRGAIDVVYREILKFGIVGGIAFVIDVGVMNLLRHTVLEDKPSTAKVISATLATLFAWAGNRTWTFRHRRSRPMHHEVALFFVTNIIAMLIGVGSIAFSHYVLDRTSLFADNVANIVGIGLGTIFRFWAYRQYVFHNEILAEEKAPL